MSLIDGRAVAATLRAQVRGELADLDTPPVLAIVVPTEDEATAWYVRSIVNSATKLGVRVRRIDLAAPDGAQLAGTLDRLSSDPSVHGVICQTPLPDGVSLESVGEHIAVAKDVDGANPASLGRIAAGLPAFAPATAQAVLEVLRSHGTALCGARAAVVGRSTVVGKPVALLLLAEHATVTVCHSRTPDLAAVTRDADVLVAAVGRPQLIGASHVRPGAVVIDVGTNPTPAGGLLGDVDTDAVAELAQVTPVPGGVGPVTTAVLLRNVVRAAR